MTIPLDKMFTMLNPGPTWELGGPLSDDGLYHSQGAASLPLIGEDRRSIAWGQ